MGRKDRKRKWMRMRKGEVEVEGRERGEKRKQ